jgi:AcrR family transcriptional regulator
MQKKDYEHITVTDIVKQADYNRATFYLHYKYKEELVDEIIDEMVNGFVDHFRFSFHYLDLHSLSISLPDIYLFDFILENANFFKLWTDDKKIPGFQEKLIQTMEEFFEEEIIQTGKHEPDGNHELLITFQIYGMIGLIFEWIKSDFSAPATYMARQLINILNGYSPRVYVGS